METTATSAYKFVIALLKTIEPGVALNAASHMALSLCSKASDQEKAEMKFITYTDGNGLEHTSISALSLIVLRATQSELKKLAEAARTEGILSTDFIETMTGGTYSEQLDRTKNTQDIVYYGVALFGKKEIIDPLTKRLSLYK